MGFRSTLIYNPTLCERLTTRPNELVLVQIRTYECDLLPHKSRKREKKIYNKVAQTIHGVCMERIQLVRHSRVKYLLILELEYLDGGAFEREWDRARGRKRSHAREERAQSKCICVLCAVRCESYLKYIYIWSCAHQEGKNAHVKRTHSHNGASHFDFSCIVSTVVVVFVVATVAAATAAAATAAVVVVVVVPLFVSVDCSWTASYTVYIVIYGYTCAHSIHVCSISARTFCSP